MVRFDCVMFEGLGKRIFAAGGIKHWGCRAWVACISYENWTIVLTLSIPHKNPHNTPLSCPLYIPLKECRL